MFLFPVEEVEKNAKIIIWGMGNCGKQYLEQCFDNYNVLFAVDGNNIYSYVKNHNVNVYHPSIIKTLQPDDFDYVVIAVYNQEERRFIKRTLESWGVESSKIIDNVNISHRTRTLMDSSLNMYHVPAFSYFGEDRIVCELFRLIGITNPTYLDIGCNHPYWGSNTALLYLTGSNGTNVDANVKCIELMNKERPDDKNILCGIVPQYESLQKAAGEEKEFFIVDDEPIPGGINSFSRNYLDYHANVTARDQYEYKAIPVKTYTLKDFLETFCENIFPDFLDIDIEGLDADVLRSYDFIDNPSPKIISAETNEKDAVSHLLNSGYIRYIITPHNNIFLKEEYIDKVILKK